MIYPKHNFFAESVYKIYLNHLLSKNFSRFLLINDFPMLCEKKGLIITPNHFSWWDGFFINYLMTMFSKRKAYLMMLEEQLVKYPFFKYLGVFSVNPASLSSVKESLAFSEKISSDPANYLVFYPQGDIQPNKFEEVSLKNGLKFLTGKVAAEIMIVSFEISYGNTKKPDVLCKFGDMMSSDFVSGNYDEYKNKFISNMNIPENEFIKKKALNIFDK